MKKPIYRLALTLISCVYYLFLLPSLSYAQPTSPVTVCQPLPPPNARFGVNVARDGAKEITDYNVAQLHAGWYLDYTWHLEPARPNGMTYVPMIRWWREDAAWQERLEAAIIANPGSLWIVGNEPDHRAQDNRTPDNYATLYHTVYTFLKEKDPTSQVAIAAVTQPTPLRLRYLEMVLSSYQDQYDTPMPIDVWTVHAYVLPEDEGWGVGIPPGLDAFADEGRVYTVAEHGSVEIFAKQLRAFRHWMADQGFREKPLLVTEFGILFPPDYGYPDATVSAFLRATMSWLQSATDRRAGYPADGYRLVQGWAWFSLNYYAYDPATGIGHNGHLLDHQTGQITPVGQAFATYVAPRAKPVPQLTLVGATITPTTLAPNTNELVTVQLDVANQGHVAADSVTVSLSWGTQINKRTVVLLQPIPPQCDETTPLSLTWTSPKLAPGDYTLHIKLTTPNHPVPPTQSSQSIELTIRAR